MEQVKQGTGATPEICPQLTGATPCRRKASRANPSAGSASTYKLAPACTRPTYNRPNGLEWSFLVPGRRFVSRLRPSENFSWDAQDMRSADEHACDRSLP